MRPITPPTGELQPDSSKHPLLAPLTDDACAVLRAIYLENPARSKMSDLSDDEFVWAMATLQQAGAFTIEFDGEHFRIVMKLGSLT